jgi:hypothetical protein
MDDNLEYLEDLEMDDFVEDDMDDFVEDDLEMIENDEPTDDFLGRRGRGRRKAKRKSRRGRIRSKARSIKGKIAKNHSQRKAKVRKHIGMLKAMATPGFFANPNNRKKLRRRVKGMAQELNGATGMLINRKRRCKCGARRRKLGFDGYNADGDATTQQSSMMKIWTNYKIPILVGGAVVFFFFTPYGKKMMGNKGK